MQTGYVHKFILVSMAVLMASTAIVATATTDKASAAYITGCTTWISGNSTYARCGYYDRSGNRINSYSAFAMCKAIIGGALRYSGGNTVYPTTTSRANCAWYERPASAGVNIR